MVNTNGRTSLDWLQAYCKSDGTADPLPASTKGAATSRFVRAASFLFVVLGAVSAGGQVKNSVVDLPTRPGVTQRLLILVPPNPQAVVVLFAGGHGGLNISLSGTFGWGQGNFLVRSRQFFADRRLVTVVVDAPSDRQNLNGFRETPEHTADVKDLIGWLRQGYHLPVWLVGTSRGTQSVAHVATALAGQDGPDGIVLTSTILTDNKFTAVPQMPLDRIRVPVLVVHHELDGCSHCSFADTASLFNRLSNSPRKQLIAVNGGQTRGDPCEAYSYHGFNGIEVSVVSQIGAWILAK
jgi:hypothetical protein